MTFARIQLIETAKFIPLLSEKAAHPYFGAAVKKRTKIQYKLSQYACITLRDTSVGIRPRFVPKCCRFETVLQYYRLQGSLSSSPIGLEGLAQSKGLETFRQQKRKKKELIYFFQPKNSIKKLNNFQSKWLRTEKKIHQPIQIEIQIEGNTNFIIIGISIQWNYTACSHPTQPKCSSVGQECQECECMSLEP